MNAGPTLTDKIVNAVAYQVVWFTCVLSAAHRQPLIAVAACVVFIAWHLRSAHEPRRELVLLLIATLVGVVVESLLRIGSFVRSPAAWPWADPTWTCMLALWCGFAATLNVSMRGLRSHLLVCALLGAVGGPLAYSAGVRMNALQWVDTWRGLVFIGIAWAIAMPLLMLVANRFDGFRVTLTPAPIPYKPLRCD
jgi:hypothetical protein